MNILRSWTFTWWEMGMLKLCLISLGLLLAVHFYDYVAPLLVLWWALFVLLASYFLVRFFREVPPKDEASDDGVR